VNPTGPDAGGVTATEDDDRRQASRMYGIKQMTLVYRSLAGRCVAMCRVRSSWCRKASVHIHGEPAGAALALKMRPPRQRKPPLRELLMLFLDIPCRVTGSHEMAAIRSRVDPGRESPGGYWGQIMKMLTSVDPFAPPKRARNTKEWLERAKLVVATARDRAVEMAQQREAPSTTRPPTWLQRHRLAKRLSAKSSRGKRRTGRLWVRKGRLA
jgi:hypothetical protein